MTLKTARALLFSLIAVASARAETAPLDIDEAIRQALAKNYAIRIQAFDVSIAKAAVTAQYGQFDPRFDLRYNYSEYNSLQAPDPSTGLLPEAYVQAKDAYRAAISGETPWGSQYQFFGDTQNVRGTYNGFTPQYFTNAGVALTQSLLRGLWDSPALTQVRLAKADRSISEWERRQTVIDAVTRVIVAYHNLFEAQENLRLTRQSRDLASNLVTENERRFQVGSASESDVTTARARVALREADVLGAERFVEAQTISLRQLISDEKDPRLLSAPLVIRAPADLHVPKLDAAADFQRALILRPDYQQSRLAVKRSELNRRLQANQYLPQVDAVGGYTYHGNGGSLTDSRRDLDLRDKHSYSAGLVLSVPLTFTRERAEYRRAKLQVKQAEVRVGQLEQQVLIDVINAASDVDNAQKRAEAARRARELTQQSLNDLVKLHRAGRVITQQVLQEQEILLRAELAEATAKADVLKALAEYDRQIGRTLERHGIALDDAGAAPRS